jgi:hypothetical protein
MQARWLKYSHQCGGTWDLQKRGEEHVDRAHKAFNAREAAAIPAAQTAQGKKSYSNLFASLR